MSHCTATIEVAGETLECDYAAGHSEVTKHCASDCKVLWEDDSPGATPHAPEPPAASYEVREGHCLMYGIVPLRWYGSNREGAEAEAERLRESGEITVEDYAAKGWAIRDLDAAREEIRHLKVRQAGDAGQIVGLRYRAEVAEERSDRYEAALRRIASYRSGGAPADVARKALGRIAESL